MKNEKEKYNTIPKGAVTCTRTFSRCLVTRISSNYYKENKMSFNMSVSLVQDENQLV